LIFSVQVPSYQRGHILCIRRPTDVAMAILRSKSAYSPSFVVLVFQNGLKYHNSDFKRFNGNKFSTLCINLVRFGPVTPEITRVIGIHSSFRKINSETNYLRINGAMFTTFPPYGR